MIALDHCKRGHPLSGDNLHIDYRGNRGCKLCRRTYHHVVAPQGPCPECGREHRAAYFTAALAEERFWRYADRRDDDGCWEWRASRTGNGYGRFSDADGRRVQAHRFAYELIVGPVPDGLHLDHLCRNRGCVNPAHLEPVTVRENNRRGVLARKLAAALSEPAEASEP